MKNTLCTFLLAIAFAGFGQSRNEKLLPGADQTELYLPYLQNKKIGMVVNATSVIGHNLSVDSLHNLGINIGKIFAPEHGFRGEYSNGVKVADGKDPKTGIPIISLYGKNVKPKIDDLSGLDLMIFDIQDVGARFYTYISTLHYVMEACAENNLELLILDRPNPNGFYVDGPVLEPGFSSFIGMHPVPIVHGMTIGEYAQMINGEGWLANQVKCRLRIIKVANYTHQTPYILPIKPSPNLNSQQSIYLYPSLCLFEGTVISQGRGTLNPFQVLGSPALKNKYRFSFQPTSITGMSENPLHLNKKCYGLDLRDYPVKKILQSGKLNLKWLLELYSAYPEKGKFFDAGLSSQIGNFDRLAGTADLKKQIIAGRTEEDIRSSWEPALSKYKLMRKKYLLYP